MGAGGSRTTPVLSPAARRQDIAQFLEEAKHSPAAASASRSWRTAHSPDVQPAEVLLADLGCAETDDRAGHPVMALPERPRSAC
jgi:hypothetical protein